VYVRSNNKKKLGGSHNQFHIGMLCIATDVISRHNMYVGLIYILMILLSSSVLHKLNAVLAITNNLSVLNKETVLSFNQTVRTSKGQNLAERRGSNNMAV
jgi:hypothetical protein